MQVQNNIDPQVYFDYLKSKKAVITDDYLLDFYSIIMNELTKSMKTGQVMMTRRLAFTLDVIEKERQLIQEGITNYVLQEDIVEYIKNVSDKAVKIIELEEYPRSIPDDIVKIISDLQEKQIFDRFYIVFTDYTDEVTKKVEAERKRKDPILFGTFEQKIKGIWDVHDRFYYIADWVDEYCDLTLAKMVDAMSKKKDILQKVALPQVNEETVRSYVHALEEKDKNSFILRPQRKSFFDKIKYIGNAVGELFK